MQKQIKFMKHFVSTIMFGFCLITLTGCLFAKPQCEPMLALGANQYKIKTIKAKSGEPLKIPDSQPDTAYWVEGTNTNYVFGLSPTENNLSLQNSLRGEEIATITWDNCNSTNYNLSSPQQGVPNNSALLDQSVSEITIFVQPDSATAGFVVKGKLMGETITTFNTPDTTAIQAEVSLLETTTSTDGKTIRVSISILNNGGSPITLSNSDVSLTPESAAAMALESSEPALPKEIKVGATETLYLTFARPSTPTATLKVFSAEYELEGY